MTVRKKPSQKSHLQPVSSLSKHSPPTANTAIDTETENALLRKQLAETRAELSKRSNKRLNFSHKGISQGGKGCLGIGGLYVDRSKWVHMYPSQYVRLRRDIDIGMQHIYDNADDMGFREDKDDKEKFVEFFEKLHEIEVFNTLDTF